MANVVLKCKKYYNPEVVWYGEDGLSEICNPDDCKHFTGCNPQRCVITSEIWTQADCRAIAFDLLAGDSNVDNKTLRDVLTYALQLMTVDKQREFAEYLLSHSKL